ncbi:AHH domain-containing protein [Xenorhabdus sp. BG5]|uniref:AHH domain-containing protein n=1 Tax=Xenorhabdus sp. BG5 TaxID=2782014 RepID=UPI001D14D073|nr:AHH domain-containing protein [Xenorhabdus sp. BG5]
MDWAWHKVKGSAAHHIVAWDDPRALGARNILDKHQIHIDSAENGIFLKHIDQYSSQPGAYHRVIHTNKYYEDVVERITIADRLGGKDAVIAELAKIREDLFFNTLIY